MLQDTSLPADQQPDFCNSGTWTGKEIAVDVIFWIDIILTFRTGYIDNRQVIHMQPLEAAWQYLRTWFLVDVLSSFPFEALVYGVPLLSSLF